MINFHSVHHLEGIKDALQNNAQDWSEQLVGRAMCKNMVVIKMHGQQEDQACFAVH